jgi:predicted amidohydrolase YtcJ
LSRLKKHLEPKYILTSTNEKTMQDFFPLKTALRMGIPLAFDCDVLTSIYQGPKWAFTGGVMRRSKGGPLNETRRLKTQEALRIQTMGSAYAGFAEKTTGSFEPGKFADR